jgi:putative phosphoesterase
MRIAILSDSHDHIPNLKRAVRLANSEGAELLIHCGDLISPFMLPCLDGFNGPVHLIYGNNPGDQRHRLPAPPPPRHPWQLPGRRAAYRHLSLPGPGPRPGRLRFLRPRLLRP